MKKYRVPKNGGLGNYQVLAFALYSVKAQISEKEAKNAREKTLLL